ncbi:MAG: RDD family protein [Candidatus Heimdallarchaeota archaeon]
MSTKAEKAEKGVKPEKPDVKVALATFNERLIAALIDYGIVYALYIFAIIFFSVITIFITWLGIILGLLMTGIGLAAGFYIWVWMPYKNEGQTIGKKMQNIKIMFIKDEAKWTLRPVEEDDMTQLLLRAIIGAIEATAIPIVIAWYFITNDKNRQRFADQLAKTVVVQCDPETKEPLKKPREG